MEEVLVPMLGRWIHPFLPSPSLVLLLTPLAWAYALAASRLAGWLHVRGGVRTPYTRKVFHFSIFTVASIIQFVYGPPGVAIYGSVVSLRVLYAA